MYCYWLFSTCLFAVPPLKCTCSIPAKFVVFTPFVPLILLLYHLFVHPFSPHTCFLSPLVLRRTNHTKWFWRDRSRAFSEKTAISLVVPVLEDAYAVGGELKPVGLGFRQSCLSDEPGKNGTTSSRSYRRAAIKVRGISSLPVTFERSLTMILYTVRQSSKET